MNERHPYRLLKIYPGASLKEVKTAYRKMAKKFHPDSTNDQRSSFMFQRIVDAYQFLLKRLSPAKKVEFKEKPVYSYEYFSKKPKYFEAILYYGNLLNTSSNVVTRIVAAGKLGRSGKKSSYAFLRKALWDPDERVVKAAVCAIGSLHIMQSVAELGALFFRTGAEIRKTILKTVNLLGLENAFLDIIRSVVFAEDSDVKREALKLLVKCAK